MTDKKSPLKDVQLIDLLEFDKYGRWNIEMGDEGIWVCKDHHEKGQKCEWELLSNEEAMRIIIDMRDSIRRATVLLQQIKLDELDKEHLDNPVPSCKCGDIVGHYYEGNTCPKCDTEVKVRRYPPSK